MGFARRRSGNPNGQPRGYWNKRTTEIQQVAKGWLEGADDERRMKQRLIDGTADHIETLLFYYAYGRPVAPIEDITKPSRLQLSWGDGDVALPYKDINPDASSSNDHKGNGQAPVISGQLSEIDRAP